MISARMLALVVSVVALSASTLDAQDLSRYRDFELGSSLSSVATTIGVRAEVKVVHRRPAMIQEIEWRPPYGLSSTRASADPVRDVVLNFYDDQLFRIVVTYDRSRTEGLTDEDMIEAVSALYGNPILAKAGRAGVATRSRNFPDATTIAQWEDTTHRLTLLRGTYPVVFQMVAVSKALDELADAAMLKAVRLDESEAPQREADQRKKGIADAVAAQEKARVANKGAFRP